MGLICPLSTSHEPLGLLQVEEKREIHLLLQILEPKWSCCWMGRVSACVDLVNPKTGKSDCPKMAYLCSDAKYYMVMHVQCPKTCGRCDANGGTIAPVVPPTGKHWKTKFWSAFLLFLSSTWKYGCNCCPWRTTRATWIFAAIKNLKKHKYNEVWCYRLPRYGWLQDRSLQLCYHGSVLP